MQRMAVKTNKQTPKQPPSKLTANPTSITKVTDAEWASLKNLSFLLAAISVLVYINTRKNGFVLDDFSSINANAIVKRGISAIPELLSTPYRHGYFIAPNDLYRPLSLVMFAIVYQFFGA